MAYTTLAGEEVGRSEANRLANLELQTAFDDLTAKGLHKQAYDLIQRGSIEAPVQVASAAPAASGLLGLNSADSSALQGLLSQFRRAEEERQFANAGRQEDEPEPDLSTGSTYNERALYGDYSKLRGMGAEELQKYIDDTSFNFKNTAKNMTDPLGLLSSALGIGPAYGIGKGLYNMDQNALAKKIYDYTYGPGEVGIGGPPVKSTWSPGDANRFNPADPGLIRAVEAQQAAQAAAQTFRDTPEMYRDTDPALNNDIYRADNPEWNR